MKFGLLFFHLTAGVLLAIFSSVGLAGDDIRAELRRCGAMSDDQARLACFDALSADIDDADEPQARSASPSPADGDQSAASNVRPLHDSVGKAPDPDEAPVYVARLTRCEKTGPARLTVFYLDNGQVWLQSNSGGRRVRNCDDVGIEITQDLFGFILRIPSQNKSRRVKRVR